MSDPHRRILSTVGPVGNHALQAAGIAAAVKHDPARPIVLCSMGDGTTQQGEVLEAIAEAVRSELPVLFWVEDNTYAISTRTRYRTFYGGFVAVLMIHSSVARLAALVLPHRYCYRFCFLWCDFATAWARLMWLHPRWCHRTCDR